MAMKSNAPENRGKDIAPTLGRITRHSEGGHLRAKLTHNAR